MIYEWRRSSIPMFIIGFFVVSACFGLTITGHSEIVQTTIFQEGFESWTDSIPNEFASNTGWLDSYYGNESHGGDHWAYSWASGDKLTTPSLTFGNDTELRFWYAAEDSSHPMTLQVKIDSTIVWEDSNFTHLTYTEAVVNLSSYTGDHTVSFIGMTSDFTGQLLDDVIITSYIDSNDEPVDNPDDGDGGGTGGGGGTIPPADNVAPVADLSKGAPYVGYTNSSVFFDGSLSYDSDGEIVKWFWTMGDGSQKTGETISYQYTTPGTYTVVLHVVDDGDLEGTDTTNVTIQEGNFIPSQPVIKIMSTLPKFNNIFEIIDVNNSIELMISSTDGDDDQVNFTIDWGDGTLDTTQHVDSGEILGVNHSWDSAGIYDVSVTAKDTHGATSEPAIVTVLMNLKYRYITGDINGYLIDHENTGNYSKFFNPILNIETSVEQNGTDFYLIDADGDGAWDYTYNLTTNGVDIYRSGKDGQTEEPSTETPGFEMFVISTVLILFVFIQRKRR
jgi:PKD repeat protein